MIKGIWYEVRLAPLPQAEYRPYREIRRMRLKPYGRSRVIDAEMTMRRLITPAVQDAVTRALIDAGPAIDDPASWQTYRRTHPDRRYAAAKRMLNSRELREYGVSNSPT